MATMTVSLPDSLKDRVEAQTRAGRYGNASDYVRDLIGRDQERASRMAAMQLSITEGFDSGISDRTMIQVLETAREQARSSLER